jgi:hypothetical protein
MHLREPLQGVEPCPSVYETDARPLELRGPGRPRRNRTLGSRFWRPACAQRAAYAVGGPEMREAGDPCWSPGLLSVNPYFWISNSRSRVLRERSCSDSALAGTRRGRRRMTSTRTSGNTPLDGLCPSRRILAPAFEIEWSSSVAPTCFVETNVFLSPRPVKRARQALWERSHENCLQIGTRHLTPRPLKDMFRGKRLWHSH